MSITTISPRELCDLCSKGSIEIIDVRTPLEFSEIHATYAKNIPLDQLNLQSVPSHANGPIYLICKSGSRGQKACEKLLAAGITNVVNVEGGTMAWEQAGLPVKRGRKVMSLERQVRIVAGVLIVIGGVLALTVHPYLVGISMFVGAGLAFAGITDSCAMGMMMAKMPWNQRPAPCSTTPAG